MLTPLVADDGTVVVVARGWQPAADGESPPPPPADEVTVEGWVSASEEAPATELLPEGQVASVHLPTLVNLLPYDLEAGFVAATTELVDGAAVEEDLVPLPAPSRIEGGSWPLQNLFYAVEWWVFGLAGLVFWFSAVRRRPEEPDGAAPASAPVEPVTTRT